ncbi:MAG TPA: PASTA domain-containing protein [Solirubrobacterales bacterium]
MLRFSIRLKVAAAGVAGAASLFGASTAQAATVTLGSPLTNALPSDQIAISATVRQAALPGATLVAPFNGQIRSWNVMSASGGWTLQVLHPSGGGFVSTASTHGETFEPGIVTFPARLPIRAGDSIGLASDSASSTIGNSDATPGATIDLYAPPLTDNAAPRSASTSRSRELGFNATIVSNCIVPKVKGKTVKKATKKLQAAGCKGKVKRKGGKRVTKQKPPAGTEVPPGTPVKLKLGS